MRRHLFHTHNAHVSLLSPAFEPGARNWRWGVSSKVRRRGLWRHVQVFAARPRPDLRFGTGTFTVEAKTWLSLAKAGPKSGLNGTKKFVRLKIGTGFDPTVKGSPSKDRDRRAERRGSKR